MEIKKWESYFSILAQYFRGAGYSHGGWWNGKEDKANGTESIKELES